MSAYVLSVDAALDLEDIWEYIAADSVDVADRLVGDLFDAFEALASTPGMGHRRGDLTAIRSCSGLLALTWLSIELSACRLKLWP